MTLKELQKGLEKFSADCLDLSKSGGYDFRRKYIITTEEEKALRVVLDLIYDCQNAKPTNKTTKRT